MGVPERPNATRIGGHGQALPCRRGLRASRAGRSRGAVHLGKGHRRRGAGLRGPPAALRRLSAKRSRHIRGYRSLGCAAADLEPQSDGPDIRTLPLSMRKASLARLRAAASTTSSCPTSNKAKSVPIYSATPACSGWRDWFASTARASTAAAGATTGLRTSKIADRRAPSRCYPTRRCSKLAASPPARRLRVSDGSVCEPAMLFHEPRVSTIILIPAKVLSIWRCTLSTSEFRNSCILWSSETNA